MAQFIKKVSRDNIIQGLEALKVLKSDSKGLNSVSVKSS